MPDRLPDVFFIDDFGPQLCKQKSNIVDDDGQMKVPFNVPGATYRWQWTVCVVAFTYPVGLILDGIFHILHRSSVWVVY